MKTKIVQFTLVLMLFLTSCKKEKTSQENDEMSSTNTEMDGTKYTVDSKNSIVNWTGFKPMGKHNGTIKISEGFVNIKNDSIVAGRFFIDMNTITVTDLKSGDGKEDLENHLKGLGDKEKKDHFFNVSKYPTSDFKITKVDFKEGKTVIFGNLTIKGVIKAVNFPAQVSINENQVTINSETLRLNRTYWNVNYASKSLFSDLKDKFINDEIEVQVNVTAKR
ncbi:YceI family protein [Flavobacterium sp. H122]|uniref:YceI family protein n=1 Tax=Flavobacterium sp. H122 TaxID=2529860 RepID=UPI0010AAF0C6|nr:YceI family protein [Flavobacterium sp. H122]